MRWTCWWSGRLGDQSGFVGQVGLCGQCGCGGQVVKLLRTLWATWTICAQKMDCLQSWSKPSSS